LQINSEYGIYRFKYVSNLESYKLYQLLSENFDHIYNNHFIIKVYINRINKND
jgi:hypothetical protein